MRCEQAATELAAHADGTPLPAGPIAEHVGTCLRCQARLAQHRKVLRSMRQLRAQRLDPPVGLMIQVLAALDSGHAVRGRPGLTARRAAYLGGLAAATAAGAAGALVFSRTNRHRRLAG